jgi:hypothetical protein
MLLTSPTRFDFLGTSHSAFSFNPELQPGVSSRGFFPEFHPEGMIENSPPIYRWVQARMAAESRQGRKDSAVPAGTSPRAVGYQPINRWAIVSDHYRPMHQDGDAISVSVEI